MVCFDHLLASSHVKIWTFDHIFPRPRSNFQAIFSLATGVLKIHQPIISTKAVEGVPPPRTNMLYIRA